MLVVFDSLGNLKMQTAENVYQGSNKANTVFIIVPFSPVVTLQAKFILPNGKPTKPINVPVAKDTGYLGFKDSNGEQMYVYAFEVSSPLTAYAGILQCQIEAIHFEGEQETVKNVLATYTFNIEVLQGVPPIDVTDINSYEDIIRALSGINVAISNDFNVVENEIAQKQNKLDYGLNTESKSIVGAINELKNQFDDVSNVQGTVVKVDNSAVRVFNADTKVNVEDFNIYKAYIDDVIKGSNLITIDTVTSKFNERNTGGELTVLNNSTVIVKKVEGDTAIAENLMPKTYNIGSVSGYTIKTIGGVVTINAQNTVTSLRRISIAGFTLPKGTYTLFGSSKQTTQNTPHLVLIKYVMAQSIVIAEDLGDGATFILDTETYCNVLIEIPVGTSANIDYEFYPSVVEGNKTGFINASFGGIKSTSYSGEEDLWEFPKTETPLGCTIDFENKTIVNNYAEYEFTGLETWSSTTNSTTNYIIYDTTISIPYKDFYTVYSKGASSRFKVAKSSIDIDNEISIYSIANFKKLCS